MYLISLEAASERNRIPNKSLIAHYYNLVPSKRIVQSSLDIKYDLEKS